VFDYVLNKLKKPQPLEFVEVCTKVNVVNGRALTVKFIYEQDRTSVQKKLSKLEKEKLLTELLS
jgi:hypothetical protein